jgi:hypothetical protein
MSCNTHLLDFFRCGMVVGVDAECLKFIILLYKLDRYTARMKKNVK